MALAELLPGPLLLLLALVAVGALVLCVLRPVWGLLLLVAVLVSNTSTVVGPLGPVSVHLVAFAAALGALLLGRLRGTVRLVWSPVFVLAAGYVGARGVSLLGAHDLALARQVFVGELRDLLLLPVLTALMASLPATRRAAAVGVGAVALLGGLTVVQEFVLDNATTFGGFSNVPLGQDVGAATVRHSGPEADVNFWGRTLVLFLPLALALSGRRHRSAGWGWTAAALVLCAAAYLTQSRGAAIALVAGALVWLLLSGRSPRQIALITAVGLTATLLVPGVASRVTTLTMVRAGPASESDRSLVDRAAVQQVGVAMFADSPLTGVGPGNFEAVQPEYRRRDAPQLSQVLAPHNVYLQMLAEGGLLGLLAWLAFYGGAVLVALRAHLLSRRLALPRSLHGEAPLAAGVVAGLVGWGIASAFLHVSSLSVLIVPIALGAALDVRARTVLAAAPQSPVPVLRHRWRSAGVVTARGLRPVGVALLVLGAAAGLVVAALPAAGGWVATSRAVVVPVPAAEGSAYATDVLSRQTVVLTYAALAREPALLRSAATTSGLPPAEAGRAAVSVEQPPATDVLSVSVGMPRREDALRLAPALLLAVQDYVDEPGSLYVLRPVGAEQARWQGGGAEQQLPLVLAVSGGLCLLVSLLLPLAGRLRQADRSR